MTAVVVLERGSRARWLARRRKGITATDVPAILGVSPWATPLDVWLDKVNPQPRPVTYAMRRGLALEQAIAAEWATGSAAIVERPPMLVAHPDHPKLLASLDFIAHTPAESVIVECKTATKWQDWEDGALPDVYAVQALTQAAITGLPVIVVADVNGRLETRRIDPQPDWEATALPAVVDWWHRHILTHTPPPLDPYRDYHSLNRVWAPNRGDTTDATPAVMGAVNAYLTLRARSKERDRTMTGLKTQIRAHMGTAAELRHPDTGTKVAAIDSRGALNITWKPTPTDQGA
jgi:putative phage-type endonuclease